MNKKIAAYGFDKLGYEITSINNSGIDFIEYMSNKDLSEYDGVFIPSGIFETLPKSYTERVKYDIALLNERDKQIQNLLEKKSWICFLNSAIHQWQEHGNKQYPARDMRNTDLVKIFLQRRNISVSTFNQPINTLLSKTNEFSEYFRLPFSAALSCIGSTLKNQDVCRTIATFKHGDKEFVVGFEFNQQEFYIPMYCKRLELNKLIDIIHDLSKSISSYISKNKVTIPQWVNDAFRFSREEELKERELELEKTLIETKNQLAILEKYKCILVTSGEFLRQEILDVLSKYFGLTIDPTDIGEEDAKILDDKGEIITFLEIKGVNQGVKEKYIHQICANRADFDSTKKGLLIINTLMQEEDIEKRLDNRPSQKLLDLANYHNVIVIRTVDLLKLMITTDNMTLEERRKALLDIILNQSGVYAANAPLVVT